MTTTNYVYFGAQKSFEADEKVLYIKPQGQLIYKARMNAPYPYVMCWHTPFPAKNTKLQKLHNIGYISKINAYPSILKSNTEVLHGFGWASVEVNFSASMEAKCLLIFALNLLASLISSSGSHLRSWRSLRAILI